MKKRLKGLLALSLVLCMVMGMTTGMASAEIENVDVYTTVTPTVVDAGDVLYSSSSGGQMSVYYDDTLVTEKTDEEASDAPIQKSDWYLQDPEDTDKYILVEDGVTYFSTDQYASPIKGHTVRENDKIGYIKDHWTMEVIFDENTYWFKDPSDYTGNTYLPNSNSLYLAKLTGIPINYTIKYADGAGATKEGPKFTVEDIEKPDFTASIAGAGDLGFTKEGFTAEAEWELTDNTTVKTDEPIKNIYQKLIANAEVVPSEDSPEMEIVLTAVWTEDTGDDTEQDEDKPGPDDEDKPGPDDEDKPGPDDEDKTGPDDEDKPGPDDADKPDPDDEDKPGPDDEDKTGPDDEDKPGPDDEDKTGPDDATVKNDSDKNGKDDTEEEDKSAREKAPKTGDSNDMIPWLMSFVIAVLAGTGIKAGTRKNKA